MVEADGESEGLTMFWRDLRPGDMIVKPSQVAYVLCYDVVKNVGNGRGGDRGWLSSTGEFTVLGRWNCDTLITDDWIVCKFPRDKEREDQEG